jgi:hypothetical protein
MKTFTDYLNEAETKTKSKVKLGPDLDAPADQPLANREPEKKAQEPQTPDIRKSSKANTQAKTAGLSTPGMADLLSRMRDIEGDDDWAGFDEPEDNTDIALRVDTENLPAVAGQKLQAAGVQNPEFHKVSNLPGNMQRAIRTLGKQLFRSMTRTPTEDIWMIANLGGRGPNSTAEVNAVAGWIRKNGEDLGPGDIDFDTSIPGYQADIHQYTAGGIRWLLVRDEFGNYIYSWPETDSVENANTRELGQDRPRIG